MNGRIRGIVFDKDGTLIHFERTWTPVFVESAAAIAGSRWLDANRSRWPSGENQLQVVRPRPELIRSGAVGRCAAGSKACT